MLLLFSRSIPRRRYFKWIAVTIFLLLTYMAVTIPFWLNILKIYLDSRSQLASICNCSRSTAYSPTNHTFNSTCSDKGTFYTQGQNVVSMCLQVPPDNHRLAEFTQGIHLNLVAMRKYYPGFTMRVYTDYTPEGPQDGLCQLWCQNRDLFWCNIRKTPVLGDQSYKLYFMVWRFLALGDPTVDVFLSRDLDSVITARESAVVKDWLQLKEKKGIQLMRDKDVVHRMEMLGGMWGAKNSWLANVTQLQKQIIKKGTIYPWEKGVDQVLLTDVLYSKRPADIVAYDSYFCKAFPGTMHRPFPIQRKMVNGSMTNDFVGNVAFGTVQYVFSKCPYECRPSYGKDWEYC